MDISLMVLLMLKIKTMDLKALSKLHGDIDAWGWYHREKDEIWLDKRLVKKPDYPIPSRKKVEQHERCHRMLFRSGAFNDLTEEQEESLCDLWAIYRYPTKSLEGLELFLKKQIMKGKSKRAHVKKMLEMLEIEPTKDLYNGLV